MPFDPDKNCQKLVEYSRNYDESGIEVNNSSGDTGNLGRCDLRLLNIVLSSVLKVKVVAASVE